MRLVTWTIVALPLCIQAQWSGEYSDKKSRDYFNIAAAAYSDDPLQCVTNTYPYKQYSIVAKEDVVCDTKGNTCTVFAAISHIERKIIISFRGTNSGKQLKREMLDSLKPEVDWYGFGLVDKYFYAAHNHLWPFIEPVLQLESFYDYGVVFTGHSLGGALATLASLKAYKKKLRAAELIHLYTYGEPRVGNKVLANNVDRIVFDSWRVVHAADIVPHLPPCRNGGPNKKGCSSIDQRRAYHHGTEVWYTKSMDEGASYKICTKDDEDWDCSDKLGSYKVNDHYLYFGKMVSSYGLAGCIDINGARFNDLLGLITVVVLAFLL